MAMLAIRATCVNRLHANLYLNTPSAFMRLARLLPQAALCDLLCWHRAVSCSSSPRALSLIGPIDFFVTASLNFGELARSCIASKTPHYFGELSLL